MYGDRGGDTFSYTNRKQQPGASYEETVADYSDDELLYQLKAVLSYGFAEKADVIRAEFAARGLPVPEMQIAPRAQFVWDDDEKA